MGNAVLEKHAAGIARARRRIEERWPALWEERTVALADEVARLQKLLDEQANKVKVADLLEEMGTTGEVIGIESGGCNLDGWEWQAFGDICLEDFARYGGGRTLLSALQALKGKMEG
jgi:hypothetical protein